MVSDKNLYKRLSDSMLSLSRAADNVRVALDIIRYEDIISYNAGTQAGDPQQTIQDAVVAPAELLDKSNSDGVSEPDTRREQPDLRQRPLFNLRNATPGDEFIDSDGDVMVYKGPVVYESSDCYEFQLNGASTLSYIFNERCEHVHNPKVFLTGWTKRQTENPALEERASEQPSQDNPKPEPRWQRDDTLDQTTYIATRELELLNRVAKRADYAQRSYYPNPLPGSPFSLLKRAIDLLLEFRGEPVDPKPEPTSDPTAIDLSLAMRGDQFKSSNGLIFIYSHWSNVMGHGLEYWCRREGDVGVRQFNRAGVLFDNYGNETGVKLVSKV